MRRAFMLPAAALLATSVYPVTAETPDAAADYLRQQGQPPADYVVAKLQKHRVVFLGEFHWFRHDVEFVLSLIPRLAAGGADALAMEILPASEQAAIDRLVTGEEWNPAVAMRLQRLLAWPYREYLEILHTVWQVNRSRPAEEAPLDLLALGPGNDWRQTLLPLGKTYDSFMAERILDYARGNDRRLLVYAGLNHTFTRFHQPEMPRQRRVEAFMDRMGNRVWRQLGEEAFTISLHRPWRCTRGDVWSYCLPLAGRIDCAADALGRPVGFDVAGSPFAELRLGAGTYYALGHPDPRLIDFVDGYIWSRPIEDFRAATLIPLAEFAPDPEHLEEVKTNNPFTDEVIPDRQQMETLWAEQKASFQDLQTRFRFGALRNWKAECADAP